MFIEISIGIAIFLFALLTFFVIQTLLTFQKTLTRINYTMTDLNVRTESLDPMLRSLNNLGEICEHKTLLLKKNYFESSSRSSSSHQDMTTNELAEWLLLSATLGQKFFFNKRR